MIYVGTDLQPQLLREPEYGMGFQAGTFTLNTGSRERGFIVNGTVLVTDEEFRQMDRRFSQYNLLVAEALRSPLRVVRAAIERRAAGSLHGVRHIIVANSARGYRTFSESFSGPAKDASVSLTEANEIFKRFSAFADDKRVTRGKGLLPGTFATTAEDAAKVRTGMEAVARYSLPSSDPANKVFSITPPERTNVQRGIVEPANSQPGGGVEVIFVDGSPDGTVTGPEVIPER